MQPCSSPFHLLTCRLLWWVGRGLLSSSWIQQNTGALARVLPRLQEIPQSCCPQLPLLGSGLLSTSNLLFCLFFFGLVLFSPRPLCFPRRLPTAAPIILQSPVCWSAPEPTPFHLGGKHCHMPGPVSGAIRCTLAGPQGLG